MTRDRPAPKRRAMLLRDDGALFAQLDRRLAAEPPAPGRRSREGLVRRLLRRALDRAD